MRTPIYYRKEIPFFYHKTNEDFRQDAYERFDPMVLRQSMIHLMDTEWKGYSFQAIIDYGSNHIDIEPECIVDLGCGVGRWIGELAVRFPNASCWGIDTSYQMLKRAHEYWVSDKRQEVDLSRFGIPQKLFFKGLGISNISFGLSRCEDLPFEDQSQDLIVSSFLFDRLSNPIHGLNEMKRICKRTGRIILVTPLNFTKNRNWDQFYPTTKLKKVILDLGFQIVDWQEGIEIKEPMDASGNEIKWKCLGMVLN